MKKLLIVLLLALAAVGFVSAQSYGPTSTASASGSAGTNVYDDSVIVTGQVSQKLTISLEDAYFNIGEIGPGAVESGATIDFGDVTIRSNVKNWTLTVTSTNGGLLGSVDDDEDTIFYTLAIAGLPTATSPVSNLFDEALEEYEITMNAKTNGAKAYAMELVLSDESANGFISDNWLSTTYEDTLTFTIAAL